MSESTPLRGRRVVSIRCGVEGHGRCELKQDAAPPSRGREKRGWIAEAIEEARDAFDALPPDLREAALRSGTRATMESE